MTLALVSEGEWTRDTTFVAIWGTVFALGVGIVSGYVAGWERGSSLRKLRMALGTALAGALPGALVSFLIAGGLTAVLW
jgi:hypothetical protein